MRKTKSAIENVLSRGFFVLVLFFSFFCGTFVLADEGAVSNADSDNGADVYKYNSLENKISFLVLAGDFIDGDATISPEEKELLEIEQQLDELVLKQNFSVAEIERTLSLFEDRDRVKSLLVGDNLSVLRFQLAQVKEIANLMGGLAMSTEDYRIKIQIENRVKFLKEEEQKVEEFIDEQNNGFSLFGWFVDTL